MGFKEAINDRVNIILYGDKGHLIGCIEEGIERATVTRTDFLRGKLEIWPEHSSTTVYVAGHSIHEPIMPQLT